MEKTTAEIVIRMLEMATELEGYKLESVAEKIRGMTVLERMGRVSVGEWQLVAGQFRLAIEVFQTSLEMMHLAGPSPAKSPDAGT
jgi:hypothetical protein